MRAFRLAYDGQPYYGFQRQPDVPTVEGALFDALAKLGVYDETRHRPSGYAAAGRTDAGVSAVAQTVAFDCPDWCTPGAVNSELPGTVRAWAAADVPDDFHATHDATRREYTYHLYAPSGSGRDGGDGDDADYPTPDPYAAVDDDRARAALSALCGEHDFDNLTPDDRNTVRELSGSLRRDGEFLVLTVSAPGFARELVRRVVSLVRIVGSGAPTERIERAFAADSLEGREGIPPAPAGGLVLTDVDYPGVEFERDEDAITTVKEVFGASRVESAVRTRVCETVLDGTRA
ncbi:MULTISPECIES: tRNA pseudouridine(38-40) synthase TruA [Haloprofundus]|uniref:tRNA pseudouridine(38-40) synthase TruA n=1 Tax=Haloprofundus TaxID=1911573 RepID=UPI000E4432A3|nr:MULTISPECIES: tRNA pseudouridine(38-40) synthase TruA [Haloprofundus]QCJ45809.1 tRNA pseudouridine(38-40) synthase TruA [Haloprofundus sp. MHR1]